MPYINKSRREELESHIAALTADSQLSDGEINYIITSIISRLYPPTTYSTLNSAIGVLECIKQEYYRRIVSKYEDKAIERNGDIYSSS